MSPTAGMYSGMKGFSRVSSSTACGVYRWMYANSSRTSSVTCGVGVGVWGEVCVRW